MGCLANNTDQLKTPLLNALVGYSKNSVSFHMPAHKNGVAAPEFFFGLAGEKMFCLDQTEAPGLDDLHNPSGVIAKAQMLAAQAFGADRTFFLVNGTSCGIHALLAATCSPGAKVILPRNIHRSVLWGLIISGADPIYTPVHCVDGFGIAVASSDGLEEALRKNPGAAAAMIVYPTYHGICAEIDRLAGAAHKYGKPLLVDEAHGAHLRFHPELPADAMSAGADASVQSTHKLGGSLTQSSMLHLRGSIINHGKIAEVLSMVQTTSPSYILMCSLDAARHQLTSKGRELLERAIGCSHWVRKRLMQVRGMDVLGSEQLENSDLSGHALDCTKILISATRLGLSGYELSEVLRDKYNIHVECADFLNVLCMITIGTTQEDCETLVSALNDISRTVSCTGKTAKIAELQRMVVANVATLPEKAMTPRAAWKADRRAIPLEASAGEISAEPVAVYPPGIPTLLPGEIITAETLEYLLLLREMGVPLQGPRDPGLGKLEVVNG